MTKNAKKKKGISAANRTKKSQNEISTINMGAVAYSGPQLQQHCRGQDCGMDMAISTTEGRHLAFSQQPHYTVTSPDTEQGHSNIPQPQQFTAVATPYGYHGHLGLVQSQPHVAAVTPTTLQGQPIFAHICRNSTFSQDVGYIIILKFSTWHFSIKAHSQQLSCRVSFYQTSPLSKASLPHIVSKPIMTVTNTVSSALDY